MRNVPFTSNVGGSELIGVVKNGKKFPFGTVSEETYNADLADITERIQNVGEVAEHAVNSIAEVSTTVDSHGVRITTAEHAIATQSQTINTLQSGLDSQSAKENADYLELTGKANVITEAVENFSVVTHGLEEDVASNEHRLDAVETSVSVLATKEASDVAALETAVDGVNTNVNALNTREAANNTVTNARIDTLNTTVITQGSRIETVNTTLTMAMNTNINAVYAAITEANADIEDLSARHTADNNALNARIDAINAAVQTQGSRIETVNTTLTAAIQNTNAAMSSMSTSMSARMDSDKAELNTAISGVNQRVTDVNADVSDLQSQHTADMNAINGRIDTTNSTLAVVRTDITLVNSNVESLSESVDLRVAELNRRIDEISGDETVTIVSFTATPNTCELGGTENVVLAWTTTGNVSSTKINGTPVTGNTYTATVTTDTRFTLEVAPAHGSAVSKSVDVKFVNHVFWGVSASASMDEGAVKALDFTELSDDRAREFTLTSNNQYIYYAYPARLGASVFFADGFEGGFTEPASISIDNHSGVSENYYVYRSENKVSGVTEIEVR